MGIIGSAVALLMIAGEFDLSVGSMVGAAGMIVAIGIGEFGWPVWLAVVAAFAFALVIGFINGYIVVKTRLPSFIVTLGTLFILRGATIGMTRTITGRTQVGGLGAATDGDPLAAIFTADFGPFDVAILWWLGLALVATFILMRTSFGNWIFGVGRLGDRGAQRRRAGRAGEDPPVHGAPPHRRRSSPSSRCSASAAATSCAASRRSSRRSSPPSSAARCSPAATGAPSAPSSARSRSAS